ncbi:ABC transporter permease [Aliirhizobium cellulosilyticum]|uniref:Sulfonate transport system permease protein n=1 Tax=Aliirhizobium cellulosilyticum TaxID=393664 RepID=A0A7W6SBB0_9HYPH|nr:ABC transporter permease [Rhizobium cellulosilyticum]MBB4350633.1 sulfonate transport system permease protein [Rhizobium cellulosilyticum]MBB4413828.1 sulfonate transport system permease protein [Rhizobium cellulosilyticum]MBB4448443.1 sulfonate transport system permease protein [Rhizobium cellulosilyticum]
MTISTQEFRGENQTETGKSPGRLSRLGGRLFSMDLRGAIVPVGALVLLELFVRMAWVSPYVLPPPSDLYTTFLYLAEGPLWTNIAASSLRVLIGFVAGSLLAIVIGSIVGLWYSAERYLEPSFQALRAVPSLAWVPLLMIWFGIGETSKVVLIAKSAFFPVYLSLFSGIRNVDRKLVEVGEMYRQPLPVLVWRILIPASLPHLFTGLRYGLSLAWLSVVAAELLAASEGIGYMLSDGRELSRPDLVLIAIICLAILGKVSDSVFKLVEDRCLSWRDTYSTSIGGRPT